MKVNVPLLKLFLVFNKLSNDTQVNRFCTCGSLVIDFKVCGIAQNLKILFFNFFRTERVKQNDKKDKNHSKPPTLV